MATTIQISEGLQKELAKKKIFDRETYEEIIWGMIEDTMEVSAQTKKEIALARKEYREGKHYTHEQIKKKYGIR